MQSIFIFPDNYLGCGAANFACVLVRRVLLCAVSSLCLAEIGLHRHLIAPHLEPSFDEDEPYSRCQKSYMEGPGSATIKQHSLS